MLFVFKHRSFIAKLHFEILLKDIFCFKVSYTKNLMWIKTFLDKDLAHTFPLAMCQISICKSSISNSRLRLSYIPPLLFFFFIVFGFFFSISNHFWICSYFKYKHLARFCKCSCPEPVWGANQYYFKSLSFGCSDCKNTQYCLFLDLKFKIFAYVG